MSTTTIKLRGTEQPCNSTANAFGNATLVRILETGTGNALITHRANSTVTVGTVTIRQGTDAFIIKGPLDTLESNSATVVGVQVAFGN
jgi:hypothetical protein